MFVPMFDIDELTNAPVASLVDIMKEQAGDFKQVVYEQVQEHREKQDKKLNLVISNLPEAKPADDGEKKRMEEMGLKNAKDDQAIVSEVWRKIGVPSTSLKIGSISRLPERIESRRPNAAGVRKPRPVRITFVDSESRRKVLSKASGLARVEHWNDLSAHKGVYIQPDKTKAERDLDFKLRAERRVRAQAGETNLVIRNGKLVTRDAAQQENA